MIEHCWSHARQMRAGDLPESYLRWAVLNGTGRMGRPHTADDIVVVVAVDGTIGDWAAYAMAAHVDGWVPHPDGVAANGDKLGETEARILFPDKDGPYRR